MRGTGTAGSFADRNFILLIRDAGFAMQVFRCRFSDDILRRGGRNTHHFSPRDQLPNAAVCQSELTPTKIVVIARVSDSGATRQQQGRSKAQQQGATTRRNK
jgi:hypothetical protein